MFLQERRCPYCRGKGYEKQLPREPRPHRCPDCEGYRYQRYCQICENWFAPNAFEDDTDAICNICKEDQDHEA